MPTGLPDRSKPCVIAGLGNPGDSYVGTRHNLGFEVIDLLAQQIKGKIQQLPHLNSWQGRWKGRVVHLLQPMTYMNRSGAPVKSYLRSMGGELRDLMVVVDDLDLEPGTIRLRPKGSAGGHRGLEDLIEHLGSSNYSRCRLGIGRPASGVAVEEFVLQRPPEAQIELFQQMKKRAAESLLCWAVEGVKNAALRYNGPLPGSDSDSEIPADKEN